MSGSKYDTTINPRSQTGLSEQSPAGPQLELVANKDSEDADGTCYRRVNHNDDSLDNDSEDLDNKAFNPKNNSSPNTESINNMKRSSTRKPSETSVTFQYQSKYILNIYIYHKYIYILI